MLIDGSYRLDTGLLLFLVLALFSTGLYADHLNSPVISIIIDDIGYRGRDDLNALSLPGPITYAVLPHAPYSLLISKKAHESGKTVILHLPMEAVESEKNRYLGPGALKLEMEENQFISTLSKNIDSIPNIIGVNNHMGSLLTKQPQQMEWLMEYLFFKKIIYIDSVTSRETVARDIAKINHVPFLKRDIFLDNFRDRDYINLQFQKLIGIAKRNGKAIAIGHPHPETIEVLENNLANIDKLGVKLVGLRDMLDANHSRHVKKLSLLD